MKRCPKCNRTFPDDNQKFCTIDGGLLRATDTLFDPNATIASSSHPSSEAGTEINKTPEPDFEATIATSSSAPTVVFPKDTGPTGMRTSADLPGRQESPKPPAAGTQVSPASQAATPPPLAPTIALPTSPSPTPPMPSAAATAAAVPAKKKSKLPLVLGILAILLVLGIGGAVAAFFLVIKPRLDQVNPERTVVTSETPAENVNNNTNANTSEATPTEAPEFVAPPNTTKFTNSEANLDGKLAEHYFDFSFYYPDNWDVDAKAGVPGASNFAKVERRLPPDYTQENFAVGWYTSRGTFADDESTFPQLVEVLSSNLAKGFPEYRQVSKGPTRVNSMDAYEFRFESVSRGTEKGDIQLWGRVIFLPPGVAGSQTGATLVMLATSLAPELSSIDDVGEKGEMPVILESFRFAKNR